MKGKKGLRHCEGIFDEFDTCLVGIGGLTGGFSGDLELPEDGPIYSQEVRLLDFDERTGRILIATNRYEEYNEDEANRIYLADLPS